MIVFIREKNVKLFLKRLRKMTHGIDYKFSFDDCKRFTSSNL
ncbi:hypothetical protein LEP1GSC166_1468 [Leptospira kirschneri]|nr:hypothetical protein LEP1GSC166_1468 [Leptospira kirschneri]